MPAEQKKLIFDISLTSYRIEKPRNPENRRKIDKILFFAYFSRIFPIFGPFSPIFRISGFFYSVAGRRDVKLIYEIRAEKKGVSCRCKFGQN